MQLLLSMSQRQAERVEVQPMQIIYIYLHTLQKMPVVMLFSLTAHGWAVDLELVLSSSKNAKALLLNYQAVTQRELGSPFPQRVCVHAAVGRHGPPLITPVVCGISDSPCIHFWSHKGHYFKAGLRHRLALAI